MDLKSIGFSCAGSNPANVVLIDFRKLYYIDDRLWMYWINQIFEGLLTFRSDVSYVFSKDSKKYRFDSISPRSSLSRRPKDQKKFLIDGAVFLLSCLVWFPHSGVEFSGVPRLTPSRLPSLVEPYLYHCKSHLFWLMGKSCSFDASYNFQSMPLRFQQSLNQTLPDVLLLW